MESEWPASYNSSLTKQRGERATSAHGTFRTWRDVRSLVAVGGKPDIANVVQLVPVRARADVLALHLASTNKTAALR
jgi:hypothetical protein